MHEFYGIQKKFDELPVDKLKASLELRKTMLAEELKEFDTATTAEEAVDALIDLCVFAVGTLVAFGVDAEKAWDEVLIANMTKEVGVKPGRPNPLGLPDLIKPEGWEAPSHEGNHGRFTEIYGE